MATSPERPDGPFSGLLVVDMTHVLAGPFGTTILNDLGARVIKIEPPGHGDDTRTYGPFVDAAVIQAMSGIMSATGLPDGPATRVGTSMADLVAVLFVFSGVASALYAREKTGKGARVDVAMFDGMLTFLEHGVMEYVATG